MSSVTNTRPILPLEKQVVDRIAAGEVIQRPASALKELLENSLDAGASSITVSVKDGGMRLLEIVDNGCGIRKEDMKIVCHRFTTSKLRQFSDLPTISTFGFRGEALASISHVAHLTITTKEKHMPCAIRGLYRAGELAGPLQSVAGNVGTCVRVENLFYKNENRRSSLSNYSEEFAKIFEVVARFAIHNASVSMTLKKVGGGVQLKTSGSGDQTTAVGSIFGGNIIKHLLPVCGKILELGLTVQGLVTSANYAGSKPQFILFINNRLVNCPALRRSVFALYASLLTKGTHPFVYLSLTLPPHNVDANAHPSKEEVIFLNQDEVIEAVQKMVDKELINCKESRATLTQSLLAPVGDSNATAAGPGRSSDRQCDSQLVRVDHREQKLTKFFSTVPGQLDNSQSVELSLKAIPSSRKGEPIDLDSIRNLLEEVKASCDLDLKKCLSEASPVGLVEHPLGQLNSLLVQSGVSLVCLDLKALTQAYFYQRILRDFGNLPRLDFAKPVSIEALLQKGQHLVLPELRKGQADSNRISEHHPVSLRSRKVVGILGEYFSITIDSRGHLTSVPYFLVPPYDMSWRALPHFIGRLAFLTNWDEEEQCFRDIAKHLSALMTEALLPSGEEKQVNLTRRDTAHETFLQGEVFPRLKSELLPPKDLLHAKRTLTTLPQIYKVFERPC